MNGRDITGIIVDAGHGGIDSGAVGNNLLEKDLTLQAATYIYDRLRELGIPAKLTRESDEYLPKEDRIRRVLSLYNNSPNTLLISNHINAGGAEGAEVVYSLKNNSTLADLVLENIGEAGQIKRKTYQRRLPENPNKDYYYILRESGNTEPILIEYGFIDNKKDSQKLQNDILDYAEGVVKAITEYINYPYNPPQASNTLDYYEVKKGDTLYSISKILNIPIEDIKKINNLKDNILTPGQKLYLTYKSDIPTNTYIVKRGDTLYSIAQAYNTTIDEIKRINNLKSNTLSINQSLLLPDNNIEEPIIEDEYSIYTVVKGDSLYNIAKKYDINVNDLIQINNLKDLTLQINQQLLVPKKEIEENESTYIVEKGDTLWSVAKKNNLEVSELKELNNLNSNLLSIGQILKIK